MLIYISSSNINKKVANTIQSTNMGESFKKIFQTLTIFQSNTYEEKENIILLKERGKGYLNHILFSIGVLIKIKSKRKNSNFKNIIYSRSELVCLLTNLIGYKNNILEIHDIRLGSLSYFILWYLKYKNIIIISINSKIKKDLVKIVLVKKYLS